MLAIRHETLYRYTEPIGYTIQQLRVTPRADAHQHTLSWSVSTPGHKNAIFDAFGNLSHLLTVTKPHSEVRILVEGVVDVLPLDRGRLLERGDLSPLVFTMPTALTRPDEAIADFARSVLPPGRRSSDFLALAEAIAGRVSYTTGATEVDSSAADALKLGRGVCQDHAHLFIACCHVFRTPARYVSGYIDSGSSHSAESHAWVDVWVEEDGFAGWVSIDVTHAALQHGGLCRLAVGRDYSSAAPVRGIRRGGGRESLTVDVSVTSNPMSQ
jgi:transglutaminase-like putative cysteine protease